MKYDSEYRLEGFHMDIRTETLTEEKEERLIEFLKDLQVEFSIRKRIELSCPENFYYKKIS